MTVRGVKYMSDFEAKKAILDVGKRMYSKGFVASNDGNISVKVGPDTIWATPTGVSKGFMTQDMLVKMDLEGKVLMGKLKPSSEIKMHLRVYKENPKIQAVTHAHPPMATCFAIAGRPLEAAILTEAILSLGTIPVAKYATPGTQEVPDSIAPFVNQYNGVLLANHGALTWGDSIYQAFYRLESVEYYATILMYTGNIIGQQNHLSCEQVDRLLEIRKNMGITAGGIPPCLAGGQLAGGQLAGGQLQEGCAGCGIAEGTASAVPAPGCAVLEPAPLAAAAAPLTVGVPLAAAALKGVTALVKPGEKACACGCGQGAEERKAKDKGKEELIAEIVRRVAEQLG